MRFYIMFGVTAIICVLIFMWDPSKKYLGIFDDDMYISGFELKEGYHWEYEADKNINVLQLSDNKWKITSNKSGDSTLVFKLVNDNDENDVDYYIDYTFNFKLNRFYWKEASCSILSDFPDPY